MGTVSILTKSTSTSRMMKSVISVLAFISLTNAVIEPGMCPPKPPTIAEFDAERYLGDWYAYATVPGFFQPEGVQCQRAQYGLLANGSVSVYNVQTAAASTGSSTRTTRTTPRCTRASTEILSASDRSLPGFSPGSKSPRKRRLTWEWTRS